MSVEKRIVFGDEQKIDNILEASTVSNTINTSYIERVNFSLRQHCRRLTRKTSGFLKEQRNLEAQVLLVIAYYNFVLPHRSLSTKGEPRRTPAMAANLTTHVWLITELLTFKVANN